jgi:tetratricopeptide (TPR) repeat protein
MPTLSILAAKLIVLYFSFELLLHSFVDRVKQLGFLSLWVLFGLGVRGMAVESRQPVHRMISTTGLRPSTLRPFTIMLGLALLLTQSACGGPQERKAQYRSKAQDYIQAGNFPKARVALRNVLKIDPKDADAYFLVAQVEEKEKNWRNAVANYQQVVDIVPDHREALDCLWPSIISRPG